ncbi:MAG: transporter [Bacteroidota bacterium]|nr:transporter [Bacteroidota bacterium]MDP3145471.1 transporter [Bacteroidota bacterium]MDP3556427.1 transporter [Bacteroidota bacterium]
MHKTSKKRVIILFFYLFLSFNFFAQYSETIRTGRPGQSIGAFTVGKNLLQFQQGVEYNSEINSGINPKSIITNNVIRFGIKETIEISALLDYQKNSFTISDTVRSYSGLSNLHLGFRVHLTNQKGVLPTTGFQMRLKMPSISKEYGNEYVAPVMIFVANWSLPKNLSLGTNWILSYNGNNQIPTGKYVVNFGFPIFGKLSGFVENYGQLNKDRFETRFDGGFAYLANNNIQFDLSAGYGDNYATKDYFVSGGISWRLNFNKKNIKS